MGAMIKGTTIFNFFLLGSVTVSEWSVNWKSLAKSAEVKENGIINDDETVAFNNLLKDISPLW